MTSPSRHRFGFAPLPVRLALCAALAAVFPAKGSELDLTTLSLEQLMQVKVVGASKYEQGQDEIAAAVSVISRQEIRNFGWRTIEEALASLPGIHLTYDRQYAYIGARGLGPPGDYNSRVLVTVNGNRINDPTFDYAPMGRMLPLDLDLIERIEFIPGPGGAVYGQNAMFGVVNLVTRKAADVGTELAVVYQDPQRTREGRASWGGRLGNTEVLLSASGMRSRGEDLFFDYGAAGISGIAAGLDGERDREFFASLRHGRWSFDFLYGDRHKDDPTAAFLSDPLAPGQYQADRYTVAQLQYEDRFAAETLRVGVRLFAGEERYRSVLSYGTPFSFPAVGQWRGGEARVLYTGIADHALLVGVEAQRNPREDQYALDLSDPSNDIAIRGDGYRYGLYLQDDWRLSPSLSATVGARVDRNDKTGTHWSPRAALIWRAAPSTTLKAMYGRAHRAPNAYERDYDDGLAQVGNPALRGEKIDTLELVADRRVGRNLALRASVYRWRLDDLITLGIDPVTGIPQYQSGPPIEASGAELSADRTWAGGARVRASVSLQDVQRDDGSRLPNSPEQMVRLNASSPLPWAGLRIAYEFRYESGRLTNDGRRLGGVSLSSLSLVADGLARGLELSVGALNLFDKRYAHPAADTNWQNAIEQDGRSLRAKLLYRF